MAVNLIFGPPGTGKTTYLIENVVAKELPNTSPDRIGYLLLHRKQQKKRSIGRLFFFQKVKIKILNTFAHYIV